MDEAAGAGCPVRHCKRLHLYYQSLCLNDRETPQHAAALRQEVEALQSKVRSLRTQIATHAAIDQDLCVTIGERDMLQVGDARPVVEQSCRLTTTGVPTTACTP